MTRRKKLYEGKAKIIYKGPDAGTVVQYFKDDATAFNAQKKAVIEGKGVLNNRISAHLMGKLNQCDIATHFIKRLNMREQLVLEVEIIPVEVVVRNWAAGNLSKRLGIEEGTKLPRTIVEFCYKSDELGDPLISEDHIMAFEWMSPAELEEVYTQTVRINDILTGLFLGANLRLIDCKLEFGRIYHEETETSAIVLADEISPDTCRLWDINSGEKMDKDRFRRDLGGVEQAYKEVAKRLGIYMENGNGDSDAPVDIKSKRKSIKKTGTRS